MDLERWLSEAYCTQYPDEVARLLEQMTVEEAAEALSGIDPTAAAAVVGRCGTRSAPAILAALPIAHAGATVAQLDLAIAAQLLRQLADQTRDAIIEATPPQAARTLLQTLRFPEGTAGAMADPYIPGISDDLSVGEVLAQLHSVPRARLYYYIYVINREHGLVGVLDLRDLLCAAPDEQVAKLMQTDVFRVSVWADRAAILAHPGWRHVQALPVVATGDRYVGALRYDTLRRLAAVAEGSNDMQSALALGLTLAEVYWAGMSRLFASRDSHPTPPVDKRMQLRGRE